MLYSPAYTPAGPPVGPCSKGPQWHASFPAVIRGAAALTQLQLRLSPPAKLLHMTTQYLKVCTAVGGRQSTPAPLRESGCHLATLPQTEHQERSGYGRMDGIGSAHLTITRDIQQDMHVSVGLRRVISWEACPCIGGVRWVAGGGG
eukprot:CAMPEP_0174312526 /NCGR_PEP_ID=MMETSP0810-20121108/4342_1 /TAXON_ID=73025 ORGANISM="Eutreptiella gymnastica-like, Strain CCMP1594" /NCGR_SAMPLE_ID=MMETSP0810 /ASSEMBLY_ACC=CAM_ASM_000659 /LENGTH=145 /DNA_ID=CAMNT_0015420935 /DNA_START=610 /DNA_END=1043 /DNA_ORIENTATION=-